MKEAEDSDPKRWVEGSAPLSAISKSIGITDRGLILNVLNDKLYILQEYNVRLGKIADQLKKIRSLLKDTYLSRTLKANKIPKLLEAQIRAILTEQ